MRRRARLVIAFLLILGAARTFLLVRHQPMYGYANNYDFLRISSWFGLWPDREVYGPGLDVYAGHPAAPFSHYTIDPNRKDATRYLSSDLIFVAASLEVSKLHQRLSGRDPWRFDLRTLGTLRASCLLLAGIWVSALLARRSGWAGITSALIFAAVLCDPIASLYFNTLYSDYACFFFAYLSLALLLQASAYRTPSTFLGPVLAVALFLLAISKVQQAALPLALLAPLLCAAIVERGSPALRFRRIHLLVPALAGALLGFVVQVQNVRQAGYMAAFRMASATNTFFGALLPNASDPPAALRFLSLPEHCGAWIGKTWFDQGMQPAPCPEVAGVPRHKGLQLAFRDPRLVVRLLSKSLPWLQLFLVRRFGQVEGGSFAQAELRLDNGLWSIAAWIETLPPFAFVAGLVGIAFGVGFAALDLTVSRQRQARTPSSTGDGTALPWLVVYLGIVLAYAYLSSILGDGLVGLDRHSNLGQLAYLVLVPATAAQLGRTVRTLVPRARVGRADWEVPSGRSV